MRTRVFPALICALSLAVPVHAESAFPEFSAKRVTVPGAGTKKRITVQIEPRAEPAIAPRLPDPEKPVTASASAVAPVRPAGPPVPVGSYAWFWDHVSPELTATSPGRLAPALESLARSPGGDAVAQPRLKSLQEIVNAYGKEILIASIGTRVSPALALAVISVESAGRADAQSGAGAQGLMQLMPATAQRFGVSDSFDAAQNIKGGIAFLDFLMEKFNGDPILVLAGYNAGENSIEKNNGVPPYAETRDYVPKVLAAFQVARGLCLTPPELVSDGCAFQIMTASN
ncbi:lytic transglycosylase domain-containing protein [Tropicibacter sp. S64]|uniref:lytic transglycosylase domain-containing protein n=1 Tax=Tropicibacter sp. S64 TaxID=3415122 RepID=UPI003C7AEB44